MVIYHLALGLNQAAWLVAFFRNPHLPSRLYNRKRRNSTGRPPCSPGGPDRQKGLSQHPLQHLHRRGDPQLLRAASARPLADFWCRRCHGLEPAPAPPLGHQCNLSRPSPAGRCAPAFHSSPWSIGPDAARAGGSLHDAPGRPTAKYLRAYQLA